jgi:hypothetical protein
MVTANPGHLVLTRDIVTRQAQTGPGAPLWWPTVAGCGAAESVTTCPALAGGHWRPLRGTLGISSPLTSFAGRGEEIAAVTALPGRLMRLEAEQAAGR